MQQVSGSLHELLRYFLLKADTIVFVAVSLFDFIQVFEEVFMDCQPAATQWYSGFASAIVH